MRARTVNEKFEEESDPIKDLSIGMKARLEPYCIEMEYFESSQEYYGKSLEKNILVLH